MAENKNVWALGRRVWIYVEAEAMKMHTKMCTLPKLKILEETGSV